jgi:hypothetical protein
MSPLNVKMSPGVKIGAGATKDADDLERADQLAEDAFNLVTKSLPTPADRAKANQEMAEASAIRQAVADRSPRWHDDILTADKFQQDNIQRIETLYPNGAPSNNEPWSADFGCGVTIFHDIENHIRNFDDGKLAEKYLPSER